MLIVAYVFPPIAYAGTHRTLRFCRYLPQNGWAPYVITIKEASDLDNDHRLLDRLPKDFQVYRTRTIDFWRMWRKRSEAREARRPKPEKGGPPQGGPTGNFSGVKWLSKIKTFLWEMVTIPDHMVFWLPFAIFKGLRILGKEKCDVIFTTSPPHSEHIAGFILSKICRKPWLADFRDPMLDSSGYAPPTRLRRKIDEFLEKLIVSNASRVLIISDHYRNLISKRYPLNAVKFITMPNGYDSERFDGSPAIKFPKFTIVYAGSFYANRSPRFFLTAFSRWLDARPEIKDKLQVLFYGPESQEARQIVYQEGLESVVHFKGRIPQDTLIPIEKGAHLLLLIIGFDAESKGTVTSKVFEYMACKRPILALIPEGEASAILRNYDKLYWVPREDEAQLISSLDNAFETYLENSDAERALSDGSHSESATHFDARIQTRDLAHIFLGTLRSRQT